MWYVPVYDWEKIIWENVESFLFPQERSDRWRRQKIWKGLCFQVWKISQKEVKCSRGRSSESAGSRCQRHGQAERPQQKTMTWLFFIKGTSLRHWGPMRTTACSMITCWWFLTQIWTTKRAIENSLTGIINLEPALPVPSPIQELILTE